jgi:hypothetical protein
MAPALRRRLEEDFATEIKRLGELIDRDLLRWFTRAAS